MQNFQAALEVGPLATLRPQSSYGHLSALGSDALCGAVTKGIGNIAAKLNRCNEWITQFAGE